MTYVITQEDVLLQMVMAGLTGGKTFVSVFRKMNTYAKECRRRDLYMDGIMTEAMHLSTPMSNILRVTTMLRSKKNQDRVRTRVPICR